MQKIQDGFIKISDELTVCPNFTFEQFKKTSFFKNQDAVRLIYLDGQQIIDNRNYIVSLFFRNNKIYMVSLICCDKEFEEKDEKERKKMHDDILKKIGIDNAKEYGWGKISSDYDARGNVSSINIEYFS